MSATKTRRLLRELLEQEVSDTTDLYPVVQVQVRADHATAKLEKPRIRISRGILGLGIVLAATLALTVLLVLTRLPPRNPQPASAQVVEVLSTIAQVAANQPLDLSGTKNTYRYLKSEEMWSSTLASSSGALTGLVPITREIWIAPDGSGRIREQTGEPIFLSERDRANWKAAGSPSLRDPINQDFGPKGLSYEDFTRYPTDPDALVAVIRQKATIPSGPPVDDEMFTVVGDLLREPGVPPPVRSALYKVATKIQGVELVGNVTDRAGRPGVAVALTTNDSGARERSVLVFDPKTSALLEEEKVLLEPVPGIDAKPPVVIGYATYLESGLVSHLP